MSVIQTLPSDELIKRKKTIYKLWYQRHMSDSAEDIEWRAWATSYDYLLEQEMMARGIASPTIYDLENS